MLTSIDLISGAKDFLSIFTDQIHYSIIFGAIIETWIYIVKEKYEFINKRLYDSYLIQIFPSLMLILQ